MASKIFVPKPSSSCTSISRSFGPVSLPKRSAILACKQSSLSCPVVSRDVPAPVIPSFIKNSSPFSSNVGLSSIWREIQGCNNWEDLVEPLHPLLREEIIRYGEFVTACYKAFNLDPNSKRFLSCKYGKQNMLNQVGMRNSGYQVTKYIYATPDVNIPIQNGESCGRWIGYVAVANDETVKRIGRRDIVITFRGTVTNHEWVANFMSSLTPARLDPNNPRPEVKVESGFLSLYTSDESDSKFGLHSCREQLLSEVSRLLNKYKGEEISISLAGHSMGSSLALLLAYDISELGLNKLNPTRDEVDIPVTVFSFGGPRVGNAGFKERCEELGVKVLRIVNVNDPITKLPGVFLNENFRVLGGRYEFPWSCSCYAHVGVELLVDFFNMQNPSCVHDLEAYIGSLLMKCPKTSSPSLEMDLQEDNYGADDFQVDRFLNTAKDLLPNSHMINILPLKIALTNVINLLQSQRTEFLINQHIYMWMNSLALYMLL